MNILEYFTAVNIGIYLFISCAPVWYVIYKCRKLKGSMELNAKYWAFARDDYEDWSYIKCALINIICLFPFRYALAWCVVLTFTTMTLLVMCGHRKGEPLLGWRWYTMFYLIKPFARLHMLCGGVVWVSREQRLDINYNKYLGPEWKPSFEGAGI